ncbi:hypothetical protein ACJ6YJ_17790 [Pseudomonas marginalis]|jgi:hypothetical protein|uniref:Uncharacterized protein n=1 Tax=Pseudomonas poae TaxID=200451 RepID=A0A7Z1GRI2_9PSED|nr:MULTISPECIES: hypothetical protein [Pseudomonas]MDT9630490.1 hypothetical protein [Pseudomonas sp. JV449]MDT9631495.1 hypothetical protein [Pseudomonas sp. JV449]NMZ91279.1 hypothetical protein [Pseudomonas marginalis]PFG69408.1 hypothetical protein DM05_3155 [Pseudomonas poae]PUB41055.1 hypothetical protein C8K58_11110 [Pseudomonas sp. GV047]
MMLLRTLVLERDGQDAPVNGALLCGFAVGQIASNFLVYSLDEEVEPASSRVYVAALRKKLDRYFLGGVESKEDLHVAMHVFKQILTSAAAGTKAGVTETQVPYHFIDLKGCKLPPARPEEHHSVIIKKALVMKVISLGMSAPVLPAIESASLIVPSIRFSSKMSSSVRGANPPEPTPLPVPEPVVEEPRQMLVDAPVAIVQDVPVVLNEPSAPAQPKLSAPADDDHLFEVGSTLTNLARVAQELAQQKLAASERETALDQWQARLQQEQTQLDERVRDLEQRTAQLHDQSLAVSQRTEALKVMTSQVSSLRQSLRGVLLELDQTLDS